MSLRYASRVVLRAAQAVRARHPAAPRPMAGGVKPGTAPAAQRPQGVGGGGRSSVPVEKAVAVEKLRRRKAQKAENVMHLVCWGPN